MSSFMFKDGDLVKFTHRTPIAGEIYEQHDGQPAVVLDSGENNIHDESLDQYGQRRGYNIMWVDGVVGFAFEHELERLDAKEQPSCPTVV